MASKKKWSDRKLWQWVIHVAIGFGWSFAGTGIIWMDAGVFVAFLVGFWSSLVSATMKEATDETVYNRLQGLREMESMTTWRGIRHICETLGWHGWSWKDFMQHAVGGFIAPWVHIWIWYIVR